MEKVVRRAWALRDGGSPQGTRGNAGFLFYGQGPKLRRFCNEAMGLRWALRDGWRRENQRHGDDDDYLV